jgi:hypothetical protein
MNVTSKSNETFNTTAFSYLNSKLNKAFPLYYPDGRIAVAGVSPHPNMLAVSSLFDDFLSGTEGILTVGTAGNQTRLIYSNPYRINRTDWDDVSKTKRGVVAGQHR